MSQTPPVVLQADGKLGETRPFRSELRRRGAKVLMAENAEQALALARKSPPDVVVLDDELWREGPLDVAEFLRSSFPSAEIILLSSRPEDTIHGIGMGLLFHGLRPVSSATLIDLVEGAIGGRLAPLPKRSGEPPMVLCVDDDQATLKSLTRILGRHGYRVATIEDPQRVLPAIPHIAPDLAVIDVLMPGLDGRELSKQIRDQYRGLFPIVLHSARVTDADKAAGFRHGADYYLPKPCDAHQLLDVVDYYTDQVDSEERLYLDNRI